MKNCFNCKYFGGEHCATISNCMECELYSKREKGCYCCSHAVGYMLMNEKYKKCYRWKKKQDV